MFSCQRRHATDTCSCYTICHERTEGFVVPCSIDHDVRHIDWNTMTRCTDAIMASPPPSLSTFDAPPCITPAGKSCANAVKDKLSSHKLSNLNSLKCTMIDSAENTLDAYSVRYHPIGSGSASSSVARSIHVIPDDITSETVNTTDSLVLNLNTFTMNNQCILDRTHIDVAQKCSDGTIKTCLANTLSNGCMYMCCTPNMIRVDNVCSHQLPHLSVGGTLMLGPECHDDPSKCTCGWVPLTPEYEDNLITPFATNEIRGRRKGGG